MMVKEQGRKKMRMIRLLRSSEAVHRQGVRRH